MKSSPLGTGKPRFTIGGVMICIAAIALLLGLLRPLAPAMQSASPALAQLIERLATIETGLVLSCLVVGLFVAMKMMRMDEDV